MTNEEIERKLWEETFGLLSAEECEAAWQEFITTHIHPGRLFAMGIRDAPPTEAETAHLEQCPKCRKWLNNYRNHRGENAGQKTVERLRRMTERLESGEPIPVTIVRKEETPDGPLHTFEKTTLEESRDDT